jgi:hypothetical protein
VESETHLKRGVIYERSVLPHGLPALSRRIMRKNEHR